MANANSPDGKVPLSLKEYLSQTMYTPDEPVRSAWLDMLKKNADEVLYTGITEPLAKAGYEDAGAALASVPSAINEFVLPSELGAWVPMMGSIKKVTKLPTAAKEPIINPPQTKPDELKAARSLKEPFLDRMNRVAKNIQEESEKVPEVAKDRSYMTKYPFVEDAVVEFRNSTDPLYRRSGEQTNRDFVTFLMDRLNEDKEFLTRAEVFERRRQIDEVASRLKRDEGFGMPFKGL
jgi:hypothetical protein